jgi:hypothetical protein
LIAASITRFANACQDISCDLLKRNEHECKGEVHDGKRKRLKKRRAAYICRLPWKNEASVISTG